MTWRFLATVAALAVAARPGSPQAGAETQPDSADVVSQARAAQEAFERRRRHLLPTTFSSSSRCDERIGRFCYWYDARDTTLPAEPEAVRVERARLLDELAHLHAAVPNDDWILGQRVRYLVEHGEASAAARLARSCVPSRWWCLALEGHALHAEQAFADADRAFSAALAAMPAELRCDWTDWADLLEGDLYGRFRRAGCDDRAALADSILWLGAPLLSRPGNDLRTELLSRRVIDWLLRTSRSPQALPWGHDVTELVARYGWPVRWSNAERFYPSTLEPASVIGHEPTPAFAFLPRAADDDPAWRFELDAERPRARYAPRYARRFESIQGYQVARFPRGDSTVLILTADLRDDTAFHRPFDLAGVASAGPGEDDQVTRAPAAGGEGVVTVRAPARPLLVGIEAEAAGGQFARARLLVQPLRAEAGFTLSDLLLFRADDSLPSALLEAARRALPAPRWSRRAPVGVYWELAGPGADTVAVAVALVPERRGLLGRIGQSLSLVKRRAPLTLGWTVGAGPDGATSRVFELDLAELGPGDYTLMLTITTPDGMERTSQRRVSLLR